MQSIHRIRRRKYVTTLNKIVPVTKHHFMKTPKNLEIQLQLHVAGYSLKTGSCSAGKNISISV
jgi:hypothetical protein